MNAQIILRPNGDFITRSNEVETAYRRVNPDDWDDDGIANERDASPTSANGGTNGAVLSVSTTNLGKLQKNSGPAFPAQSVSVPARQSITYAMNYVGLSASESADDIEVVATLTDNVTGESITNDCHATSVRLELAAGYEAPENPCTNRHVYGVGEKVKCKHLPQSSSVSWDIVGLEYNNSLLVGDGCDCVLEFSYIAAEVPNLRASCCGAEHRPELALMEPTNIVCRHIEWDGFHGAIGVAGGFGMNLDLYVLPMTVSFQGIDMVEEPCNEIIPSTGYYAALADEKGRCDMSDFPFGGEYRA